MPEASRRILSGDEALAESLRRFFLGALSYVVGAALLWIAHGLDFIPVRAAIAGSALMVAANAVFYALLRSGYSRRYPDPGLATAQTVVAMVIVMFLLYHMDDGRELALVVLLVIFQFGAFRFTPREFIRLALYTLLGYALVINLLMQLRPAAIRSVYVEWLSWLVLASVLPWFAFIGRKIGSLRHRLQEDGRQLDSARFTIEQLATRDQLTGVHNLAFFRESLAGAIERSDRRGKPLAVLRIDVDRLRAISDGAGIQGGDEALQAVAVRLRKWLRRGDLIARLGGDEFVVLVEEFAARADVSEIAERMVEEVARPFATGGQEWPLSVSVGIAVFPEDGADEEALMANAAAALASVKPDPGVAFRFYVSEMGEGRERFALERDLRAAVARGELRLRYQPKVSLASGRVVGVEALVRWQHPQHGLIGPARFVPLAEEAGLIAPIGRWVLETACERAAAWRREHGLALRVAVNLSAHQFRSKRLDAELAELVARVRLDPALLELEVTESMVMADPEVSAATMRALRGTGFTLAMDDFGTGHSSLGNLKRFPFHVVKVDRAFITDLPASEDAASIARAVIAMSHSLRLSVIAEGVEREDQVAFLRAEGCEEYQGYYCSAPLEEGELLALLAGRGELAQAQGRNRVTPSPPA